MEVIDLLPEESNGGNKVGRLPRRQDDLKNLAKSVAKSWKDSTLTLAWKTADDLEADALSLEAHLYANAGTKGSRKTAVNQLKELDKTINKMVGKVKDYLDYVKGEQSKSYYGQYGIIRINAGYAFPADRDSRVMNLKLMIDSVTANGDDIIGLPLSLLQQTYDNYANMVEQARNTSGSLSGSIGDKDQLIKEVRKTLVCLIKLIEANYPDNTAAVLRKWGFQKEKY